MTATAEHCLRFEPRLVENAVYCALRGRADERTYHRERERLYKITDAEERERAFHEFDGRWFANLRLAEPIEQALMEAPLVLSSVGHCLVAGAPEKKAEGAELFVPHATAGGMKEKPTAAIFLQPKSLLDAARLLDFLRHELLHLTDMLDPGFAYEPALPAAEGGPTHDRLLKERYRVLWDAAIDGRMLRRGWAPASVRDERWEEFARAFSMLGAAAEVGFRRFFDRDRPVHAELVAFASDPRNGAGKTALPGSRCALCGFPTYDFAPSPDRLPDRIIATIAADFPAWRPSHGLCVQCAELYRAREMSLRAASELPGLR